MDRIFEAPAGRKRPRVKMFLRFYLQTSGGNAILSGLSENSDSDEPKFNQVKNG